MAKEWSPDLPPNVKQHRCHARLADAADTITSFDLLDTPKRVGLYISCLRSEAGQEPAGDFRIDPKEHTLRYKPAVEAQLRQKHELEEKHRALIKSIQADLEAKQEKSR